ncbi:hypothetical protein [Fodinicola feengrottensis]|uniref:hypothetical protein n=1 Tax=Fodinicola feengrottensis TaxID=435914 RepID=UPI002441D450|nr:hypothetical protein [Fodinicola feengrottensis]
MPARPSVQESIERPAGRVALVTLGCARNEVDSEELAGRLAAGGWELSEDTEGADVVLVNTCGFIEQAKKDSVDTILQATDSGAKVVATGCMAERYGKELAEAMPEADAVLGFDHYPDISDRLLAVLSGEKLPSHVPSDRRKLLPISPVDRAAATAFVPGHTQDLPAGVARGVRPPSAAQAPGGRPGGAAEDRLRLRPTMRFLRHPVLPRCLHLAPAGGAADRGPLAG